jgi:hypothetical protein
VTPIHNGGLAAKRKRGALTLTGRYPAVPEAAHDPLGPVPRGSPVPIPAGPMVTTK